MPPFDAIEPMRQVHHIHLVGIGGIGMSGIARVLLNQGYHISGSDCLTSPITQQLVAWGAVVHHGHHAAHVQGADVLVYSAAVNPKNNPELIAAHEQGIPVIPRAQMLAELMRFHYGIAVTGTHGKTTTTSMIASVFTQAQCDPTFVIGGQLNGLGTSAQRGTSRYFIVEADESDASFLYLQPMMAVVTNIDADHLEAYGGSLTQLHEAFLRFIHHLPFYGLVVLCMDDPVIRQLLPHIARPRMTYGFSEDADVRLTNYQSQKTRSQCLIQFPHEPIQSLTLQIPGKHNALNAAAAMIIAKSCQIPDAVIKAALARFVGVQRRFQIHEDQTLGGKNITVVDDYGHHPREIQCTLETVRSVWPGRRIVLVYQPHRYSRTQQLFQDFVSVLSQVDHLILLGIYAASEPPIPGVSSQALAAAIDQHPTTVQCVPTTDAVLPLLPGVLLDQDILILQGAGDIGALVGRLLHAR